MGELAQWVGHVIGLARDSATVWWRCLPRLLTAYALGLAGHRLSIFVAPFVSNRHPWLALAIIALGLVSILSGMIVCLRILGNELGVADVLPDGAVHDDRDQSIYRLLAITLLPFLGIYATFGQINDVALEMFQYETVTHGVEESALAKLNPVTLHQSLVVAAVVVVTYVVRRAIDLAHEHTDVRPLGLVAAVCEAFFMLVVLVTGSRVLTHARTWLRDTVLGTHLQALSDGLHASLGRISHYLPTALDQAWRFWSGTLWPIFTGAVFQPLLWLAVAALVYGSHVLSLAEMWHKGEPLAAQIDERRRIELTRRHRSEAAGNWARRLLIEVQEAFFGDVDDKYLPTLQSVRLVLRMGLLFLAGYVVCYALIDALEELITRLVNAALGARTQTFWLQWASLVQIITELVTQPMRLALLATALVTILRQLRERGEATGTTGHEALEAVR